MSWLEILRECEIRKNTDRTIDVTACDLKVNAGMLVEIVSNFADAVPVDIEHASELTPGSLGVPAIGWVKRVDLRCSVPPRIELWGEIEWVPGYPKKTLPWLSAAVRCGTRDRVTGALKGAALVSVACIGRPPLDGHGPMPDSEFVLLVECAWTNGSHLIVTSKAFPGPGHVKGALVTLRWTVPASSGAMRALAYLDAHRMRDQMLADGAVTVTLDEVLA